MHKRSEWKVGKSAPQQDFYGEIAGQSIRLFARTNQMLATEFDFLKKTFLFAGSGLNRNLNGSGTSKKASLDD